MQNSLIDKYTPGPGIEPGYPEGNRFSRPTQYHCAIRAYNVETLDVFKGDSNPI